METKHRPVVDAFNRAKNSTNASQNVDYVLVLNPACPANSVVIIGSLSARVIEDFLGRREGLPSQRMVFSAGASSDRGLQGTLPYSASFTEYQLSASGPALLLDAQDQFQ